MKKKKEQNQVDLLPDGTILDLDSYEFPTDNKLSKKEKRFLIWFTLPNQSGFKDFTQAALKAGYSTKSSYQMKSGHYQRKLKPIADKMLDENLKTAIKDAYQKVLQIKMNRAFYDVRKFYETEDIENEDTGQTYTRTKVKKIDELSKEDAEIIDNVEFTTSGIATFKLPNKEKELNDIIKLNSELNEDKSTGDYDVATIIEMTKDTVSKITTKITKNNQIVRENARNYIENSENLPEDD